MWQLVDFLVCWMLLTPEARRLVYDELRRWNQPREWQYEYDNMVLIGA